ncbi:hypothetical protein HY383_04830 [Candidatus Daviesbacteria bacterium]|nr:hypothetical protein [Candidatus Daviesbacteria bacterium]
MLIPKTSNNQLQTNRLLTPTQSAGLESFTYPNSKVISSNSNVLVLESSDSANAVTNWYKQQIRTEGMNTTSFVTTNTNGNVLNKLVGSNSYKKIDVEIRQESNQSAVKMIIYVN